MKNRSTPSLGQRLALPVLLAALAVEAFGQEPSVAERIMMLKDTLTASKAALRQYEWLQTTVTTVEGKEKSRKQERCFYGDDGSFNKIVLSESTPEPPPKGFFRRRSAEKEQADLKLYMDEVIGLIRAYVPPDVDRIVLAKNTGHFALQPTVPGKRARMTFSNYLNAGDSYALNVDLTNNRPIEADVKSYVESSKDPMTVALTFGTLEDGTLYPANAVLDDAKKKLKVTLQNSGYKKRTSSPTPGKVSN